MITEAPVRYEMSPLRFRVFVNGHRKRSGEWHLSLSMPLPAPLLIRALLEASTMAPLPMAVAFVDTVWWIHPRGNRDLRDIVCSGNIKQGKIPEPSTAL